MSIELYFFKHCVLNGCCIHTTLFSTSHVFQHLTVHGDFGVPGAPAPTSPAQGGGVEPGIVGIVLIAL